MKKIIILTIVLTLCSCAAMDTFLGVNDKGDKTPGTPPVSYITEILKALGPIGIAASGLVTVGASAYVGNKKGSGKFTAVVAGIQKAKDDMTNDEREQLVSSLKKHIPNKYHAVIKKAKDTL